MLKTSKPGRWYVRFGDEPKKYSFFHCAEENLIPIQFYAKNPLLAKFRRDAMNLGLAELKKTFWDDLLRTKCDVQNESNILRSCRIIRHGKHVTFNGWVYDSWTSPKDGAMYPDGFEEQPCFVTNREDSVPFWRCELSFS